MRYNGDGSNLKEPANIAPVATCEGGRSEAGSSFLMPSADDVDDGGESIVPISLRPEELKLISIALLWATTQFCGDEDRDYTLMWAIAAGVYTTFGFRKEASSALIREGRPCFMRAAKKGGKYLFYLSKSQAKKLT